MDLRRATSIPSFAAAILGLLAGSGHAQDAPSPSPATLAAQPSTLAARSSSPARAGIEASDPRYEQAARESAAKMDAIRKAMDARIARVTRSICAGCTGTRPVRRPHLATPDSAGEPSPRDPAEAPVD